VSGKFDLLGGQPGPDQQHPKRAAQKGCLAGRDPQQRRGVFCQLTERARRSRKFLSRSKQDLISLSLCPSDVFIGTLNWPHLKQSAAFLSHVARWEVELVPENKFDIPDDFLNRLDQTSRDLLE